MTSPRTVYVPGRSASAPLSPSPTVPFGSAPTGPDLSGLRKLTVATTVFQAITMVAAVATALFTGFIAYTLFAVVRGMAEAFEQSGV